MSPALHPGMMCCFVIGSCKESEQVIVAQIVRHGVMDTGTWICIDTEGDYCQRSSLELALPGQEVEGRVLLTAKVAKAGKQDTDRLLQTKAAKRALEELLRPTKPGAAVHLRTRPKRSTPMPEPEKDDDPMRRGTLEAYQVPDRLTIKQAMGIGGPGLQMSPEMERYLSFWCGLYRAALGAMLDRHQGWFEVWCLSRHQGMSKPDIAAATGRPYHTVKSWLFRAQLLMDEWLGDWREQSVEGIPQLAVRHSDHIENGVPLWWTHMEDAMPEGDEQSVLAFALLLMEQSGWNTEAVS